MNPLAWLLPGLTQFRRRRRLAGTVLAGSCAALVAVTLLGEVALRRSHAALREVAPRSVAGDSWAHKDALRGRALQMFLLLCLVGALEGMAAKVDAPAGTSANADGPRRTSGDGGPEDGEGPGDADGSGGTSADAAPDADAVDPARTSADA